MTVTFPDSLIICARLWVKDSEHPYTGFCVDQEAWSLKTGRLAARFTTSVAVPSLTLQRGSRRDFVCRESVFVSNKTGKTFRVSDETAAMIARWGVRGRAPVSAKL